MTTPRCGPARDLHRDLVPAGRQVHVQAHVEIATRLGAGAVDLATDADPHPEVGRGDRDVAAPAA
ncbi:hypothetical protein [Salana multivorans]